MRSRAPASGLAAATKYTAGIVVLPLLVACGVPAATSDRRAGPAGRGGRGVRPPWRASSLANPHALLSFDEFWSDVRKQEDAASGFGKLGLDYDSGLLYYLWVLTWGLGWVPLAAAVAGAVRALREDVRRALFLVPWPLVFIALHGTQERYFGRWLLPAFPALALLAGVAVAWVVDALRPAAALRSAVAARSSRRLLRPRASVYSVHVDRVLSRDDTRNLARAWMVANVPAGLEGGGRADRPRRLVRRPGRRATPGRPARAASRRSGRRWVKFPTGRTTIDEQGRTSRAARGASSGSRTTSAPCARRWSAPMRAAATAGW